jgi:hypothetical protein
MTAQDFEVLTTRVDNTLDQLNGRFRLSVNSLDYRDDTGDEFNNYYSTAWVRVENNEAIVNDLVKACAELHEQTGYWGRYIEQLSYDTDSNTIRVEFGS